MKDLYKRVAQQSNLPEEVVEAAYKSFWQFIYDSISALPLKEDITEEEFNQLKVNFNIPELGKLYTTYDKVSRIKEKYDNDYYRTKNSK